MPTKDLEKRREYKRNYARKWLSKPENRQKTREFSKRAWIKRATLYPEKRLFKALQSRCVKLGWVYDIEAEDLLPLPKTCPYLGLELDYRVGNGRSLNSPSVDRIDNTKGYIKGNIEIVSSMANTMKSCASKEQLQQFAQSVLKKFPIG